MYMYLLVAEKVKNKTEKHILLSLF